MTHELNSKPDGAQIHLSAEASIVLLELLSRWCTESNAPTPDGSCFKSTAECAVLVKLLADLEAQLSTPFCDDYPRALKVARDRLKDDWSFHTLRG